MPLGEPKPDRIRLETERDRIRGVPARWSEQYVGTSDLVKIEITRRLHALNLETATAAEINEIIGNDSWTSPRCDVCQSWKGGSFVWLGAEPDFELTSFLICQACAARVVELIQRANAAPPQPVENPVESANN